MKREYKKIALGVEAKFLTDGTILPRAIWLDGCRYTVERILAKNKRHPMEVGCIAPIEYAVIVDGYRKVIYYEPSAQQWFSVKEVG